MAIHKLNPARLAKLKDGMHGDGGRLWIQVTNGGRAKSGLYRYTHPVTGKRTSIGMGSLETIGIDPMRDQAKIYDAMLRKALDPKTEREKERLQNKLAQGNDVTFRACAEGFCATEEVGWGPSWTKNIRQWLANYIYPKLGDLPVRVLDINHSDNAVELIFQVLEPIWRPRTETARKVHLLIEGTLNWAFAKRKITSPDAASLKGPLGTLLPKIKDFYEPKHHESIPHEQIGKLMAKIRASVALIGTEEFYDHALRARIRELHATGLFKTHEQIAKQVGRARSRISQILREPPRQESCERPAASYVAEFTTLTAVRVGQARKARWEDIDDSKGVWVCEKHKIRKKTGKAHVVPLSKQALYVLEQMKQRQTERGLKSEYVFLSGSRKGIHSLALISTGTVLRLIKEVSGKDITTHGMRTTFGSWAEEHGYEERDSEMALGHTIGNNVRNIYKRYAHRIEPRRKMMQAWADYCDRTGTPDADVVPFKPHKAGEAS